MYNSIIAVSDKLTGRSVILFRDIFFNVAAAFISSFGI